MYCKQCGSEVGEDLRYCSECGADMLGMAEPITPYSPLVGNVPDKHPERSRKPPAESSTVVSAAALILGIFGVVLWLVPVLNLFIVTPGLILGFFGLGRKSGRKMAAAGIILNGIGLVLALYNLIFGF